MYQYKVMVQHPCIELQDGSIIPNFITVGTLKVGRRDPEMALLAAKELVREKGLPHSVNLIMVEEVTHG